MGILFFDRFAQCLIDAGDGAHGQALRSVCFVSVDITGVQGDGSSLDLVTDGIGSTTDFSGNASGLPAVFDAGLYQNPLLKRKMLSLFMLGCSRM